MPRATRSTTRSAGSSSRSSRRRSPTSTSSCRLASRSGRPGTVAPDPACLPYAQGQRPPWSARRPSASSVGTSRTCSTACSTARVPPARRRRIRVAGAGRVAATACGPARGGEPVGGPCRDGGGRPPRRWRGSLAGCRAHSRTVGAIDRVRSGAAGRCSRDTTTVRVDPVLLEIPGTEVGGHLETIDAWLATARDGDAAVNDGLLRAIHTLNGAFAMTEVPSVTAFTAPAETYVKRFARRARTGRWRRRCCGTRGDGRGDPCVDPRIAGNT